MDRMNRIQKTQNFQALPIHWVPGDPGRIQRLAIGFNLRLDGVYEVAAKASDADLLFQCWWKQELMH